MAVFKAREILYTNVPHLPYWLKNIIHVEPLLRKLVRKKPGIMGNVEPENKRQRGNVIYEDIKGNGNG